MVMLPVSSAELTQIRTAAAAVLSIACTIQRKTPTRDTWGTETETFSTVATVNVGMRSPTPGELLAYADLLGAKLVWRVNFPYGQDVRIQDHLIIGSDTMVVHSLLSAHSYPAFTTVLAAEIQ